MKIASTRLKICNIGCILLKIFNILLVLSVIYLLLGFFGVYDFKGSLIDNPIFWSVNTLVVICIEALIFWTGIIMVYLTSGQLGFKIRLLGILFGSVPIMHFIMLGIIIKTASREEKEETEKYYLNLSRKKDKICKTKYPLLLVHGVFFRDYKYFNYWGRIPKELEKNGAKIYYGMHNSADCIEDSAKELEKRINQIIEETGCEKVNIIAHSKGGLDAKVAAARGVVSDKIASVTTICTPHRGCEYADYLLTKIPKSKLEYIAQKYNKTAEKLGDTEPDFISAVKDLTTKNCKEKEKDIKLPGGIFYQSVGSKLNKATSGSFPLNFTYQLVKYFDGINDGLVGEESFEFGEKYVLLETEGKEGISHGDIIDLNRKNLVGFDVREFYVQLVADLKNRGL